MNWNLIYKDLKKCGENPFVGLNLRFPRERVACEFDGWATFSTGSDIESQQLERMVLIGLWYVQEYPFLRPYIKVISHMLEDFDNHVKFLAKPYSYLEELGDMEDFDNDIDDDDEVDGYMNLKSMQWFLCHIISKGW